MQSGSIVSFTVNMKFAMHLKAIALLALPLSLLFGAATAKNYSVVSITFSPSDSVASVDLSWLEVQDEVPSEVLGIEMGNPSDPVWSRMVRKLLETGRPGQSSVTTKQRLLTGHWMQFDWDLFKFCLLVNKTVDQLVISESLHRTGHEPILDEWLCQASANGCVRVVRNLLEMGADPEGAMTGQYGMTALHWAAKKGRRGVVKVLLDRGASPDTLGFNLCTPLHFAASNGHIVVVKLLLDYGADPNWADVNEWTPLHSAASEGHLVVVLLLLDNGADPDKQEDVRGHTPIDVAFRKGHMLVVHSLCQLCYKIMDCKFATKLCNFS